jgi:hypothetical protein
MSLIVVSDSDSDSDIPTPSSYKQLRSSIGPLTPQFPHPFFLTSIKTIFIAVRLTQTLLDRNVRVYGTRRAKRGIPCAPEGEGSIPEDLVDLVVQVWKDKICANDKYDP